MLIRNYQFPGGSASKALASPVRPAAPDSLARPGNGQAKGWKEGAGGGGPAKRGQRDARLAPAEVEDLRRGLQAWLDRQRLAPYRIATKVGCNATAIYALLRGKGTTRRCADGVRALLGGGDS